MKNKSGKPKIGILTMLYHNMNYGGVLQAYALAKILNDSGYEAEHILFDSHKYERTNTAAEVWRKFGFREVLLRGRRKISAVLNGKRELKVLEEYREHMEVRRQLFEEFLGEIPHGVVFDSRTISETNDRYDCFVFGSDQIWNPLWNWHEEYFGSFVRGHRKIAYAASIGENKIPVWYEKLFSQCIAGLDEISVREESAETIVKKLCGRTAVLVLDPVLLADPSDWEALCAPAPVKEKYMFCYFLGKNKKNYRAAKAAATVLGCTIVAVPFTAQGGFRMEKDFGDLRVCGAGPKEFLSLLRHAAYVMTDSFHGAILSMSLQKDFWAVDRVDEFGNPVMSGRLKTLLAEYGLSGRMLDVRRKPDLRGIGQKIDYGPVNERLRRRRKESLEFLRKALERGPGADKQREPTERVTEN